MSLETSSTVAGDGAPPSGPDDGGAGTPRERPRLIAIAGRTFALAAAIIGGVWLLQRIWPVVMALVVALVLFGTFHPLIRYLERRRWRRGWAVALLCFTALLVVGGLGLATIPALWEQVTGMVQDLPRLQSRAVALAERFALTRDLAPRLRQLRLGGVVSGSAVQALAFSSRVITALGYGATALVLAIYFLLDPSGPRTVAFALTPRRHHVRLARILAEMEIIVGGYVRGQIITSALIMVFAFGLLSLLRVPNALALAVFAGLTDVVPFVGGLLATAPAALAALARGPWIAAAVVVAMAVYQELESRIIVPRVYGRVLRLSPPAVILALVIGGELMGIMGALLALPVAASIRMLITELRVELPGAGPESAHLRARDARIESAYVRRAEGASIDKAAELAAHIAADSPDPEAGAAPIRT